MPRRGGRTADIGSILDLLGDGGFRVGVICGALAAAVAAMVALRAGGGPRRHPWAGLAFAAATLVGFEIQSLGDAGLLLGLAVLALGGVLGTLLAAATGFSARWRLVVDAVVAVPGAVLVARSADVDGPGWIVPGVLVVIVVGGALVADFDRMAQLAPEDGSRLPSSGAGWVVAGLPPVLLAVTVFGVWVTVPETEHVVVLAGVTLPVALLGWPRPLASLGTVGASLVTALVGWTVAVDGADRPGAVIGGFACLGILAIEPATRWALALRGNGAAGRPPDVRRTLVVLAGLHVVVVAVCARVAGLETSAVTAFLLSVVTYAVAAGAVALTPPFAGDDH